MAGDIILSNGTTITASEVAEIASEVKKLIAKEAKEPSQYEEVGSLANLTTLPALLQNGSVYKLVRVAVELLKGMDGKEVSLRKTETSLQWQLGDQGWNDLLQLSEIKGEQGIQGIQGIQGEKGDKGDSVSLRLIETAIQWQREGDDTWQDLITVDKIQEPAKAATDAANAAATKANTAATNADTATGKANTAASSATSAANAANNAASYANEMADHTPIIGEDGLWYRWNTDTKEYEDTGLPAKGDTGQSFKVIAQYDTEEDLNTAVPDGSNTDGFYAVGETAPYHYYSWTYKNGEWGWVDHGVLMPGNGIYLTESEFDALEVKDQDKTYFVFEG